MEILNFYTEEQNYLNTTKALYFALKDFFANLLLDGDTERIVYARNSFALRKRYEDLHKKMNENDTNIFEFDLPFINIYISDITTDTEREWFYYRKSYRGYYVPELKRSVKMLPVKVSFESTYFIKQHKDLQFATYNLLFNARGETNIAYPLNVGGLDFDMFSVVNYNLGYESEYTETDWLEKNKIRTIELNPTIDTFFLKDTDVSLSKTLILNFRVKNNIDESISDEDVIQLLESDFN